MLQRKLVPLCLLLVCLASAASAQTLPSLAYIPLTIEKGVPIQLRLTERLHFKENEPVHAKIAEPVFAFDREVLPSGTEVLGRITGLHKAGKGKRILNMLAGDFSPMNEPSVTFDT